MGGVDRRAGPASDYTSRVHELAGSLRHKLSGKSGNHDKLLEMLDARIASAQRFNIGDITKFIQETQPLLPCKDKFVAPFPLFLVESSQATPRGHFVYLVEHIEEDDYTLATFGLTSDDKRWLTANPVMITALPGGQFELTTDSQNPQEAFDGAVSILRRFQLAIMANESVRAEITSVPAKQTVRSRLGKALPIYSHKVLTITPRADRRSDGMGSHASPRVHLRRGHYRLLRGGRRVWVRPSTVGDKSRGMVTKDYAVKPVTDTQKDRNKPRPAPIQDQSHGAIAHNAEE